MKQPFLIAVLFLLSISPVQASNWFPITSSSGSEILVDTDSIVPAGKGLTKAWVMHSLHAPKTTKAYPPISYQSVLFLQFFNCSERTAGILQEVYYSEAGREGEVVRTNSFPKNSMELIDVIPGSVGEGALNFACNWVKRSIKK